MQEAVYLDKLRCLMTYDESSLLIIDNYDEEDKTWFEMTREPAYRDLCRLPMHVLFTTRNRPDSSEGAIEVTALSDEELLTLMHRYLSDTAVTDKDLLALIRETNGHTLLAELIARTLATSLLSPRDILKKLHKGDYNAENLAKITTEKDRNVSGDHEKGRILDHLNKLFRIVDLPEAALSILPNTVLIPEVGMNRLLFANACKLTDAEALQSLVQKGWIQKRAEDMLFIHPLIRIVVMNNSRVTPTPERCDSFLATLDLLWEDAPNPTVAEQAANAFRCALEAVKFAGDYASQTRTLNYAAKAYKWLGKHQIELGYKLQVMEILEKALPPDHPDLAEAYNNVGLTCGELHDYEKTLQYTLRALEIRKNNRPLNYIDLATSYHSAGLAYGALGEFEKSLDYILRGLEIRKTVLPPDHIDLAASYHGAGLICYECGNAEKGLEYTLSGLKIMKKVLPPDHPYLAGAYNNVGLAYEDLGEYQKALEYTALGLKIRKKILPPDHPDLADSYHSVGQAYANVGEYQKALKYMLRGLKIRKRVFSPDHPDFPETCMDVEKVYEALGNSAKALEYKLLAEMYAGKEPSNAQR